MRESTRKPPARSDERRDNPRFRRRVPVRFWKRGEDRARSGFTTNISNGGMFIGSNQVLPPDTRLRIEVLDPKHGFHIEGIVARAKRSRPELRSVQTSGMGVRFLRTEELVAELFPKGVRVTMENGGDAGTRTPSAASAASRTASAESPAAPGVPAPPESGATGAESPAEEPSGEGETPAPSAPPAPDAPRAKRRGFAVTFRTEEELRTTFERDIRQGGLFIATRKPAEVGDTVIIELRPPEDLGAPLRVHAKVVHRFERGDEENLLSGMGVELADPDETRRRLEALLGG